MKREPAVSRPALLQAIGGEYGLVVDTLTFVPSGEAAACYRAATADGGRYFLKLWPRRLGALSVGTIDGILVATRALYEQRLFTRLAYPIRTRDGALVTFVDSAPVAVFPLLSGRMPALSTGYYDRLGHTLAAIHRATPAVEGGWLRRERFTVWYETDLIWRLDQIADIGPGDRPGRRALRAAIQPLRGEIVDLLARTHELRAVASRLESPFTLCHNDMGAHNLLEHEGDLFVLDWDNAQLSRPECDLLAGLGPRFGRFLAAYRSAGGRTDLSVDLFAFFRLRGLLEDAIYRIALILDYHLSPAEDAHALYGIDEWCVRRWRALDRSLAAIGAAL